MITATPRGGNGAHFIDDRFAEVKKSGPDPASSSVWVSRPHVQCSLEETQAGLVTCQLRQDSPVPVTILPWLEAGGTGGGCYAGKTSCCHFTVTLS